MIKVAAKRSTPIDWAEFTSRLQGFSGICHEVLPPRIGRIPFATSLLHKQVVRTEIGELLLDLKKHASGKKPVSALLTDPRGRILCASWSSTGTNRTLHAELRLVHSLYENGSNSFPDNSTLWVSLRPCAMCSAQILAFSNPKAPVKVCFLEDDPGPASKNSCLFPGSELWIAAGKPLIEVTRLSESDTSGQAVAPQER
jgi:hypothetical protein